MEGMEEYRSPPLIPMNWGMNMNSKIQPKNPNPEKENPYLNNLESQGLKREN
jgi:hypothetical protein